MKKIKFLSLAVAALMMAACSSDEIASVAQKGSAPLEIVPVVKTQTRAAQITMDNLTALTVDVTGTFVTADGNDVVNPVLTLAKSGSTWSYTYNGDNAGPLYWPNNAETATFSAHTLADGAAVNELTAQTDVVGDYTTKEFDGTNNPGAVALELKHAVSKMQFKARIQGEAADELKVKIDIKQVAVRAMNYAATYAKPAAAEATMGVLALGDSPAKADLTVASASAGTFITLNTTDATASTDLGHLFMVPQTVTAETLSESTWDDSYIAVYAQIRTVQGDVETMVFPTVGAVDETSYAWVAVPMPSDFTQMQAHHKYIFTINYSADALGKVDRNQEPVIPGGGEDIEIEGRSSQPVTVTVENVYDFEEEGEVDVNMPTASASVPAGAIDGLFSISATQQVYFSQGNLQYQPSTATWRFADNQYSLLHSASGDMTDEYTATYTGWIDFFGWGTSGWNNGNTAYMPYSTYNYDSGYGPKDGNSVQNDLTGSYADADWGWHNAISNGGNATNMWRTLTNDEWSYLFNTRETSTINGTDNARYAKGKVNNVYGVILFPDDYTHPAGVANPTGINVTGNTGWNGNNYDSDQWSEMEAAGAVFLPAAGFRDMTWASSVNSYGYYWATIHYDNDGAYIMKFDSGSLNPSGLANRCLGYSVRVVKDAE